MKKEYQATNYESDLTDKQCNEIKYEIWRLTLVNQVNTEK